jgi:hypothetical protein
MAGTDGLLQKLAAARAASVAAASTPAPAPTAEYVEKLAAALDYASEQLSDDAHAVHTPEAQLDRSSVLRGVLDRLKTKQASRVADADARIVDAAVQKVAALAQNATMAPAETADEQNDVDTDSDDSQGTTLASMLRDALGHEAPTSGGDTLAKTAAAAKSDDGLNALRQRFQARRFGGAK